jgi:hypothetical protein
MRIQITFLAGLMLLLLAGWADADPRRDAIESKLKTMTISFDFDETPLADAIDFIRDYTEIDFVIHSNVFDAKSEDELMITMKITDLNLKSALKLLMRNLGLKARYEEGVIMIVPEDFEETDLVLRVYDIRDLLFVIVDFPGPNVELKAPNDSGGVGGATFALTEEGEKILTEEFIEEMVREYTGGKSWDENGEVSLVITENGQMMVNQSVGVHEQIQLLLGKLRRFK